jgi:hypothetical protein
MNHLSLITASIICTTLCYSSDEVTVDLAATPNDADYPFEVRMFDAKGPIEIVPVIHNRSDHIQFIDVTMSPVSLELITAAGKSVERKDPTAVLAFSQVRRIRPNESIVLPAMNLLKWYDLPIGDYVLKVRMVKGKAPAILPATNSDLPPIWRAELYDQGQAVVTVMKFSIH